MILCIVSFNTSVNLFSLPSPSDLSVCAMQAAGLTLTLQSKYAADTVFASTNAAFASLFKRLDVSQAELLADTAKIAEVSPASATAVTSFTGKSHDCRHIDVAIAFPGQTAAHTAIGFTKCADHLHCRSFSSMSCQTKR